MSGLIYIAHRLFAAHDRSLAARVAQEFVKAGYNVFLPFCDTNEDTVIHPQKGRWLFEQDCERIRRLECLIAILHGPQYDEGVCMEIGYAIGLDKPVVVLTTDFLTYGSAHADRELLLSEPLIELTCRVTLREPDLPVAIGSIDSTETEDRYGIYSKRNDRAIAGLIDRGISLLSQPFQERYGLQKPKQHVAFVECFGGDYLELDLLRGELATCLGAHGYETFVSARLKSDSGLRLWPATKVDWDHIASASLFVVVSLGVETPPGAAFIVGIACAIGRPVLMYYSGGQFTLASGRESNRRNLMLEYGVVSIVGSVSQLSDDIKRLNLTAAKETSNGDLLREDLSC